MGLICPDGQGPPLQYDDIENPLIIRRRHRDTAIALALGYRRPQWRGLIDTRKRHGPEHTATGTCERRDDIRSDIGWVDHSIDPDPVVATGDRGHLQQVHPVECDRIERPCAVYVIVRDGDTDQQQPVRSSPNRKTGDGEAGNPPSGGGARTGVINRDCPRTRGIADMPAIGNSLEVRVGDAVEEWVVRERGGSPAVAHLRVIDRDRLAVIEGQLGRSERENDAAKADWDSGIPVDRNISRRSRCGSRGFGERDHTA